MPCAEPVYALCGACGYPVLSMFADKACCVPDIEPMLAS